MDAAFDTDPDLLARAAQTTERIERLEHQGQFVWVKREERLSLRMRLQKGAAASAFERERAALRRLSRLGVPAPPILAEGPDFFVIPDSGISLQTMVRENLGAEGERRAAFVAAAQGLAQLHARHVSHGHPRLKDICWKDGRITFIDFERFSDQLNKPRGHARDLATFVFSAIAEAGGPTADLDAARDAYRAADGQGIWDVARDLVRSLRFIEWLSQPFQLRPDGKSREFKAIPATLRYFDVV
jgi:tRNA A-37 threonylcarbamoyl transferase component Bud32